MIKDIATENLVKKTPEQKLHEGLKVIPESQMLKVVQVLHHQYLPKVVAARGESHSDTLFFQEIRDCLLWALLVMEKYNDLNLNYSNQRLLLDFYQNRCRLIEKELDKYNALEDLEVQNALDDYRSVILERAKNMLNANNTPK
jgi:hypothetical protein